MHGHMNVKKIKAVFVTHKIVFTAMNGSVLVNQAYWIRTA